ncbi:thioredoxin family protein [Candidatus Neomarinimicrobiota bacterium]
MPRVINIIIFLVLFSCSNQDKQLVIDEKTGKVIIVGDADRSDFDLPEFSSWFVEQYENYEPDSGIVKKIKDRQEGITIEIFFGTWCKDSRREVPRLYKILDRVNFNHDNIELLGLDRKKRSPKRLEKNKNIELVPTFIINNGGNEIGRIIEFPIITLEQDLFRILLEN